VVRLLVPMLDLSLTLTLALAAGASPHHGVGMDAYAARTAVLFTVFVTQPVHCRVYMIAAVSLTEGAFPEERLFAGAAQHLDVKHCGRHSCTC
jgi:hypothetical protein